MLLHRARFQISPCSFKSRYGAVLLLCSHRPQSKSLPWLSYISPAARLAGHCKFHSSHRYKNLGRRPRCPSLALVQPLQKPSFSVVSAREMAVHGSDRSSSSSEDEPQIIGLPTEAVPPSPHIRENVSKAAQDESLQSQAPLSDGEKGKEGEESPGVISSRAYQLEMLDQSLRQNVIVAMDTGSGKTQVAVLRIKAEIERATLGKIVWFLAPTISLCAQQFEVIKLQIPAAKMRLLTSQDNVDTWDGAIWQVILEGVNIVVSTYQVLLDALNHAFITMNHLSLLVFDEAHNCMGKNPGQKLLRDYYRPYKLSGKSVPAILGLTATPSIRSHAHELEQLELTMDAKCVSPTIHRDELLKCVKRPQLKYLTYTPNNPPSTSAMRSLHRVYCNLDIREDPYILSLRANLTDRNRRELIRAIEKHDTYTQNQIKGLCSRASGMCRQLGPWAADLFISKSTELYLNRIDGSDDFFDKWSSPEKKYLADALRQVEVEQPSIKPQRPEDLSEKASLLIEELVSAETSVSGIIFVQERAMVTMLYEVLWSHDLIREKYRIGTMVGTSNFASRKKTLFDLSENVDLKALENFRTGKLNLLIATSVLEEGIDVRACNLVICFDRPATPKSFIQRRGRARMSDSQLVLFQESSGNLVTHWESLELEMRLLYEDQERESHRLGRIEEDEDAYDVSFVVPSTGARLDFDNAKSHLDHFCSVLSKGEYVDSRPDYIIHRHTSETPIILSATVLLPSFVPADLRRANSSTTWLSEKNATKDAAFQAYVALYKAQLVNDNLLPLRPEKPSGAEARARETTVEAQLNPWITAAKAWNEPAEKWLYSLECVDGSGRPMGIYEIVLPVWLNRPQPIPMFVDRNNVWKLQISEGRPLLHADLVSMPDHTSTLLALHFASRWPMEQKKHVIRVIAPNTLLSMDQIGAGKFNIEDESVKQGLYLIRDPQSNFTPFLYQNLIPCKPSANEVKRRFDGFEDAPTDVPYLSLSRWTKRSDFLHPVTGIVANEQASSKLYQWVLPLPQATVDVIPVSYVQFGMMIPSLIHKIEVMLVARQLAETLLRPVRISNLDLVREAICAPGSGEPVNYERLEFLGDSILKFCTSVQASAQNPHWPEGYLSLFRDRLVANSRLSRATIESGLSKFIITRAFTGHHWRPLYLDTYLPGEEEIAVDADRKISTKTLADVVEALIGASYVDGGISKALKCISLFLRDCDWKDISAGQGFLFDLAADNAPLPPVLAPLEEMIGYTFRKKALLIEAVTHGSYIADTSNRSYERLEFLGDAVLDNIIVAKVFSSTPSLPHYEMHLLKTAMVNGDFIAFMIMEHGLRVSEPVVTTDDNSTVKIATQDTYMYLWKFMRHASLSIGLEQKETAERHSRMREDILQVMKHEKHYPWDLLAHLRTKKFYSDLFEALLGAVWIDSGGDMEVCKAVVAKFGILDYLDRILRDGVNCTHPKEQLGRLAVSETVVYDIDVRENPTGEKEYVCSVTVGERMVVEVDDGMSREEVQTKAAHAAVVILTAERSGGQN